MKGKAEVLAPAGSMESMKAAVLSGADAVYMGGSRFGARAYAENPGEEELLKAIDYVHFHNKKIYLTVNTLFKEEELRGELYSYLVPYYEQGLDAAIVQDLGVFSFLKREFPDLPLHLSTQMTLTGPMGTRYMEAKGASRAVLARELSLEEIRQIRRETDLELEVFVHGAICYCYSGQCLFSSMLGGRSGNRGRCAQPCRLPYEVYQNEVRISGTHTPYVMNLKDMCSLELLPELLSAGVDSLKLEGRMKSPLYTAGVTGLYRKYVDLYAEKGAKGYRVEPEDLKKVSSLFDRGGYTSRYFTAHNGKDMISPVEKPGFRASDASLTKALEQKLAKEEETDLRPVAVRAFLKPGSPFCLTLTDLRMEYSVTEEGPLCQQAQSRPVTVETVKKQLSKMGGTGFFPEKMQVSIEGDCFLPLQAINELRRTACAALQEALFAPYRRKITKGKEIPAFSEILPDSGEKGPSLAASLEDMKLLPAVLSCEEVSCVELECESLEPRQWKETAARCRQAGKEVYLSLPRMFRQENRRFLEQHIDLLREAAFDGFLLRNLEELAWLRETGLSGKRVADDSLPSWNREARSFLKAEVDRDTVPQELKEGELYGRGCRGSEMLVYGRVPLMITANCLKKTCSSCNHKPEWLYVKDRKQMVFPVRTSCRSCYNILYNSLPLCLFDQAERLKKLELSLWRLHFTTETPQEVKMLLSQAADCLHGRDVSPKAGSFTRGHFKRGVE